MADFSDLFKNHSEFQWFIDLRKKNYFTNQNILISLAIARRSYVAIIMTVIFIGSHESKSEQIKLKGSRIKQVASK
jgi:hypothetical protein